ncbi:DUF1835 domain-containing protein [Bacillus atrophaeus]|uniref:DUF1835 domain-containing protein n=1 Tax=Bacillus atrophaeus TaxID=1452 RepID=UPI0022822660|nr:DUF1835 domain-containing protein [Bacillus atrophaeus]MCY8922952.1 DUF1835 domain-containing protein [Bacillus atrophaeus]
MVNKEKIIHIVFGMSIAGSLKFALKKLGKEDKEKVICFCDIFSVGPIKRLHEKEGLEERKNWLRSHFSSYDDYFNRDYIHDFTEALIAVTQAPEYIPLMIWTGENSHEQTGLRLALFLLKDKKNDIMLINTNQAYQEQFQRPDRDYTPLCSGEISPEKFGILYKKYKLTKPISLEMKKSLVKEWETLSESQDKLRLWTDKIHSVTEDHYDSFIIKMAQKLHDKLGGKEFIKSVRLVGEVLGHLEQYLGDQFIEYRVRHLIKNGTFEIKGSSRAIRNYSIKLARQNR